MASNWVTAGNVRDARQKWEQSIAARRSIDNAELLPLGGEAATDQASRLERAIANESTSRALYDDAIREFAESQRASEYRFAKLMAIGQLVLAIGMAYLGYMQLEAAREQSASSTTKPPPCKP